MMTVTRLAVILGRRGAGKTTVARELARVGFAHVELSVFLKELRWQAGERGRLRTFVGKMRRVYGPAFVTRRAVEANLIQNGDVVITGVRTLPELVHVTKLENVQRT